MINNLLNLSLHLICHCNDQDLLQKQVKKIYIYHDLNIVVNEPSHILMDIFINTYLIF